MLRIQDAKLITIYARLNIYLDLNLCSMYIEGYLISIEKHQSI